MNIDSIRNGYVLDHIKAGASMEIYRLLGLDKAHVNLKATTEEGLGFTGRAEGIKAYAVVSALTGAAPSFSTSIPSPDL